MEFLIGLLQLIMVFVTPISVLILVVGFIWGAFAGLLNKDTNLPMRLGLIGFFLLVASLLFWWIFPLELSLPIM